MEDSFVIANEQFILDRKKPLTSKKNGRELKNCLPRHLKKPRKLDPGTNR
jgi:hypothetical protein